MAKRVLHKVLTMIRMILLVLILCPIGLLAILLQGVIGLMNWFLNKVEVHGAV